MAIELKIMIAFPSEYDFNVDSNNALIQNISNLRINVLEKLKEVPYQDFSSNAVNFVDRRLPCIWKSIALHEHDNLKPLNTEIYNLTKTLCEFLVHVNLNPTLMESICKSINVSHNQDSTIEIMELKESDIKKLKSNEVNVFKDKKLQCNAITKDLIMFIIKSGVFLKVNELFEQKLLTLQHVMKIINLFNLMSGVINPMYVAFYLPNLMKITMSFLSHKNTAGIYPISDFISRYCYLCPNMVDDFLELLSTVFNQTNLVQHKSGIISSILTILWSIGVGKSETLVKDLLLNAIESQLYQTTIKQILEVLPLLAQKIEFNTDDLERILSYKNCSDDQKITCISNIIQNMPSNLDKFALSVLKSNNNVFNILCFNLIDHVESKSISRKLFNKIMACIAENKLSDLNISTDMLNNQTLINQIERFIKKSTDYESLHLISYFFIDIPKLSITNNFIIHIINLSKNDTQFIDILHEFSLILSSFESDPSFNFLFDTIFENYKCNNECISQLNDVLLEWIEYKAKLPFDYLFKKLMSFDFINCNTTISILIKKLLKRITYSENFQLINDFLMKILEDTVPATFSSWFIEILFYYIHDSAVYVDSFIDTLFKLFEDERKFENAVYLLYYAAIYEADYFNLTYEFCYQQQFILFYNEKCHKIKISFHPFHSARRVYAVVGSKLKIKINDFSLTYNDGTQEKYINYFLPLPNDIIKPNESVVLNVNVDSTESFLHSNKKEINTVFLNGIQKRVSNLFDFLGESGDINELLFCILLLFKKINKEPTNSLQQILYGKCDNPLDFIQSIHIFHFALNSFIKTSKKVDFDDFETIMKTLIKRHTDIISRSIACISFKNIFDNYSINNELVIEFLLDNPYESIRAAILPYISISVDQINISLLLNLSLKKQYRSRSKQFYALIKKLNMNPEIFVPFYTDMEQFETSHYSDIDETFIALISLIPQRNEEMIKLTINRLFSPPTCHNTIAPFVHTLESWSAAFKYLLTPLAVPYLLPYVQLLPFSKQTKNTFSSDFTNEGRNGIQNMGTTCYVNSILQIFNGLKLFSSKLISLKDENIPPFVNQLRILLAKLRFVRKKILTIDDFVQTIPKFNPLIQEDVEEFYGYILSRLNSELKDYPDSITDHLHGRISVKIYDGENVVSSSFEDFYYLSIPTLDFSQLKDAFPEYFKEEIIDYTIDTPTRRQISAIRKLEISEWPDYLVIQLQRLDFQAMERKKLVNEFSFPIQLKTDDLPSEQNDKIDYTLTGVIVHQGSPDQGHYYTIVQGDDDEWYLCNDKKIDYFDINEISNWAFGATNNLKVVTDDIPTAYLLFYKKVGIQEIEFDIPPDLEELLNKENQKNWPSIIFSSDNFINYIKNLVCLEPSDMQIIQIGLQIMFKVASSNEQYFHDFIELFQKNVFTSHETCLLLYDFIENTLKQAFGLIYMYSDEISSDLTNLLINTLKYINDNPRIIRIILDTVNFRSNGTINIKILGELCTFIYNAFEQINVDWSKELDLLENIFKIITLYSRESMVSISDIYFNLFDKLMYILNEIIENKGYIPIILNLFEINNLNTYSTLAKRSKYFDLLLIKVLEIFPSIFHDVKGATNQTRSLLNIHGSKQSNSPSKEINWLTLYKNIKVLFFSQDNLIRKKLHDIFCKIIGEPKESLKESMINSVYKKIKIEKDPIVNVMFLFLVSCMSQIREKLSENEDLCNEYIHILYKLSKVSPQSFIPNFDQFQEIIILIKNPKNLNYLEDILHHILAYDPNLVKSLSEETIKFIISLQYISKYSTQMVYLLKDFCSNSRLVSSCVEYYMYNVNSFNFEYDIFIDLINQGIFPPIIDIPITSNNFYSNKLAVTLWYAWGEKKDELSKFMMSSFKYAIPFCIYSCSDLYKQCAAILEDYCPNRFHQSLIDYELIRTHKD